MGEHTVTIVAVDGRGFSAADRVIVTVLAGKAGVDPLLVGVLSGLVGSLGGAAVAAGVIFGILRARKNRLPRDLEKVAE